MIALSRNLLRSGAALAVLSLLAFAPCPGARAADKDKEKKPEKEKKEKIYPWIEVRTEHFIAASDGGEKTARRFADQFEALLGIFQSTMPKARVTTGIPVRLLISRDGESFGHVVPEFPFSKTRDQPAGAFVTGPEKTYIAIRANASGRFVFEAIYRDYARAVLKLSYRNLPPWVEEGYSTVYSSVTFSEKGARLERPDPDDMSVVTESPLLPLDLVLGVDRASPYYNPGNTGSVYTSESRVLLQFLITDPQTIAANGMDRYLAAVQGGADSVQSARNAFGDLNNLQSRLEAYIRNVNGPAFDLPAAPASDAGGTPRSLSASETEARLADFLALRGRDGDAQDKLEEAVMNEPSMPEAEQNLAFLLLKRDDLAEAEKHFERATQLDPKDGLNFYGLGLVAQEKAGSAGTPAGAAEAFEKAVALNPEFAPAWYNLAKIYSERDGALQKALTDVQRAAALVPGNSEYQLKVADLLDQMGQRDEARKTAEHVKESASDKETADKAGAVIARISNPRALATAPATNSAPATKPPADSGPRLERKTEADSKPAGTIQVSGPAKAPAETEVTRDPAPPPPAAETGSVYNRLYSMVGAVSDVNCSGAPEIQLTLKSMTISMKLHSDNFEKLSIKSADSAAPARSSLCSSLRGRLARISYHLVSDKPWDGEMQEMELRGQP